eukprot:COSAG01_NODE_27832_length_675_cov_102.784722_1_plen_39_part_10
MYLNLSLEYGTSPLLIHKDQPTEGTSIHTSLYTTGADRS